MKPDWDKLAKEYDSSKDVAIVDVDCTKDDSKDLCSKYGVRGYPTIKYFTGTTDPKGDKYEGGRTFADLKKFADENLGPSCGPDNLDLCDDEQTENIKELQAQVEGGKLQATVDEKQAAIDAAEKTFKDELASLQAKYEQLSKDKDATVEEASKDLGLMRAVLAAAKTTEAKDEL
jgi:protein disulfide-isomerase A6